jgi:hypothetical protein
VELKCTIQYDVLASTKNKRYAKKEIRKGLNLVAVKIVYSTMQNITVGKNVKFYSGDEEFVSLKLKTVK